MPTPKKPKASPLPDVRRATQQLLDEAKRLREQSAELRRSMKELRATIARLNDGK
jgi:prefoldin subunit 5